MSFDRMIKDPDYYAKIQKTKLVVLIVLSTIAYAVGAFDEFLSLFQGGLP